MLKLNIKQIREIYEYARRGTSVIPETIGDLCADWLEMNAIVIARESPVLDEVLAQQFRYSTHWRDKPEGYWLARLMEEVGELAAASVGDHQHLPDDEL
jgi:hypothetical protein